MPISPLVDGLKYHRLVVVVIALSPRCVFLGHGVVCYLLLPYRQTTWFHVKSIYQHSNEKDKGVGGRGVPSFRWYKHYRVDSWIILLPVDQYYVARYAGASLFNINRNSVLRNPTTTVDNDSGNLANSRHKNKRHSVFADGSNIKCFRSRSAKATKTSCSKARTYQRMSVRWITTHILHGQLSGCMIRHFVNRDCFVRREWR